MTAPLVDVTIAVHSRSRPIARAVASVVEHTAAPVRVNVIAHNIDPSIIEANLGAYATDPRVRLLSLRDDIPSPAGPMNFGFAHSEAPFISLMGSDDELAPGAIDSWLALQQVTHAEVVLAKIRLTDGRSDPYPPVRAGRRTTRLDGQKDRLAYRSAPLGLIDRARFGSLRLTEGLASGEDLTYSLTLWFTARDIAYDLTGPAYVVHGDAEDRVTSAPRPVAEDFAFLDELESLTWFATATRRQRLAIVTKLIRIHVFDAILPRTRTDADLRDNRAELLGLLRRFSRLAPGVHRLLSRADRAVFAELAKSSATPDSVLASLSARLVYMSPATLLTRNPLFALHRQAPFRTLFAGYRIRLLNSGA